MKIHTQLIGSEFPLIAEMIAGPKLLAGFTDVPVRPMPRMCTNVSVRPITKPPNDPWLALADVTPRIAITKIAVRATSTTNAARTLPCTPAVPLDP